ncbi:MAG: glycosyltransferase family 39 protein [Anaerolineae bacterium]|nr:glycosyltransferase family 39 protein [Anaerolineae bacterium]
MKPLGIAKGLLGVTGVAALAVLAAPQLVYPFGHDQGIYAACGDVIRKGGVPIRDCFESKGPGVMVLYALALSIHHSTVAVHAFTLAWQALTAVLVGLTARALFAPAAALPAAVAYWLIYAGINYWSMNQAETFSNLFLTLSLLLSWLAAQRDRRALAFLSGVSAGILLWFKYVFGLLLAAVGLGLLVQRWLRAPQLRAVLGLGAAFAAGALSINALVLGYFALVGGIPALVEQLEVFLELFPLGPPRTPPEIAQMLWRFVDNGADLTADYKPTVVQWIFFGGGFPLLFLVSGVGVLKWARPLLGEGSARYVYLLALFIAGLAVVVIQAKYVQYHFTILHPTLAIAFGGGAAAAWHWLRGAALPARAFGALASLGAAAAVALLGLRMVPWVMDTYSNVVVQRKSLREMHLESRVAIQLYLADYIVQHTQPDDAISLFADAPWVYMLTQRSNATRFPFADVWAPAHGSRTNARFAQQFFEAIQRNRPKYFILTEDNYPWLGVRHIENYKRITPLYAFVEANYQYEVNIGPFIVFRRRD